MTRRRPGSTRRKPALISPPVTPAQREILARISAGESPLLDVRGRRVGAVCRNLLRLLRGGYVFEHRRTKRYALTPLGRAITGA